MPTLTTPSAAPTAAHPAPTRMPFSGLWIALVTPFKDGAVDHPALAALTARLRAQGVAGFVACEIGRAHV